MVRALFLFSLLFLFQSSFASSFAMDSDSIDQVLKGEEAETWFLEYMQTQGRFNESVALESGIDAQRLSDVRLALDSADQILDMAYVKSKSPQFVAMRNKLKNVQVQIPGEKDFKLCLKRSLAFTFYNQSNSDIFLCSYIFENMKKHPNPINYLAQTLIHESVHLLGFDNECVATRFELKAMHDSGIGPAYYNSYVSQCGLYSER